MYSFNILCHFYIHSTEFAQAINMFLLIRRELFYIVQHEGILNHYTFPLLQVIELCSLPKKIIVAVSCGT